MFSAYLKQVYSITAAIGEEDIHTLRTMTYESPVFCPDKRAAQQIQELIEKGKQEGDSYGGIIEFIAHPMPVGLGDPVYDKLEARLAFAMMSLPATKGFEMGSGFGCIGMTGSEHNDVFIQKEGKIATLTNYAGGVLGGISTGMPVVGRVAFKPTSSIMKAQQTVTTAGDLAEFRLPEGSRHDPCVAIRAVPIVEAMAALVLADALLVDRSARL